MGQPKAKKHGSRSKIKKYKRSVWLCNREKDLDQIQDEIELQSTTGVPVVQRLLTNNDPILLTESMKLSTTNGGCHAPSLPTEQENPPILPYDDELPGGGQFYCVETAKYFINAEALVNHKKTKFYKRRCKELLKNEKYTQQTAEWAAGKTKQILPPAHSNKNNNDTMKDHMNLT